MNGKMSKKLRKIANEELRKLSRSEEEILTAHANYLKTVRRPKLLPYFVWSYIVNKIMTR